MTGPAGRHATGDGVKMAASWRISIGIAQIARDFGTIRFFRILGLEKQCSILTRICTLF